MKTHKVALFIPCLTEHFFPHSALSMVKILEYLGVEVEYVEDQTCCGQPAFNAGYHKKIVPVAERFITLFRDQEAIIAPSGSCVAMVRASYSQLPIQERYKEDLEILQGKIFEFTEYLTQVLETTDLGGTFPHSVTYHDSCHLSRELGIKEQPRTLIKNIADIEFIEMPQADECCGFGGTFSYKFKELSVEMVKEKCKNILSTGAEFCIGADSSCLMNIEGYAKAHDLQIKTLHITDLLAQSLNL